MEDSNSTKQPSFIPAGWTGGFAGDAPYPNQELLDHTDFTSNTANIHKITRMLRARWPQFSWETTIGDPSTRMYQMFAPDISRLGYDDRGQVWSIICPQQGVYLSSVGLTLNVEVTVTGTKGWINEDAKDIKTGLFAADITIRPTVWLTPNDPEGKVWKLLQALNTLWGGSLPLSKDLGIRIYGSNSVNDATLKVRMGEHPGVRFPEQAKHWDDYAWTVANVDVLIGNLVVRGDHKIDEFNFKVMELFNVGSGNLLQAGNTLTWNLWAGSPELVNREEWSNHAEYWRRSIDVNHRPPEGEGTSITDFDGNPFTSSELELVVKAAEFVAWIGTHLL